MSMELKAFSKWIMHFFLTKKKWLFKVNCPKSWAQFWILWKFQKSRRIFLGHHGNELDIAKNHRSCQALHRITKNKKSLKDRATRDLSRIRATAKRIPKHNYSFLKTWKSLERKIPFPVITTKKKQKRKNRKNRMEAEWSFETTKNQLAW